jgi:hypothetical protein
MYFILYFFIYKNLVKRDNQITNLDIDRKWTLLDSPIYIVRKRRNYHEYSLTPIASQLVFFMHLPSIEFQVSHLHN